jgi:hypothetical protein
MLTKREKAAIARFAARHKPRTRTEYVVMVGGRIFRAFTSRAKAEGRASYLREIFPGVRVVTRKIEDWG